ncbi:MAG TPA: CGGC domain-containing protein [Planctomycetota bacterium]|nr:CGGC domain-containing protein [Planctomycetota bacterium]HRR79147.1 CGGC domain-containing protein [Planctomycetota bacterium]HRT94459.1 CGGC domain-containing protein [Planctomycetota bacterium]
MSNVTGKDYIVVVQCDLVKQRCSGYFCEQAFHARSGGFADYARDKAYRTLYLTCGGCCGRALQRKLAHLVRKIHKQEAIERSRLVVQLSSCITHDSHHAPPCPHLDYMKTFIARLGLDVREGTHISQLSERRRREGVYQSRGTP